MRYRTHELIRLTAGAALALGLVLSGGCGKKDVREPAPPVDVPPAPPPVSVDATAFTATINALHIYDERSNVGEKGRILYMPEAGFVGKKYDLSPELIDTQRELIEEELRRYFVPATKRVEVDVYVVRGHQFFEVGEMREFVEVKFGLRIEIGDAKNLHEVWLGSGGAEFKTDAVDVPREWVDDRYTQAIRDSVQQAVAEILRGSQSK